MFLLYVLVGVLIGGLCLVFLAWTQSICCQRCTYVTESINDLYIKFQNFSLENAENMFHNEKKLEKLVDYHVKQFLVNFERELNNRKK